MTTRNTIAPLPIAKLGERILTQKASEVPFEDFPLCKAIVDQMLNTLDDQGQRIGLAAPQVFIDKRIVIFRIPKSIHSRYKDAIIEEVPFTVMINPLWRPVTDKIDQGWEACISLPNLMGIVPRYTEIEYEFYDLDGILHQRTASGFHSRVVQHECDHLDGYVYINRMKDLSSLAYEDVALKNSKNSDDIEVV